MLTSIAYAEGSPSPTLVIDSSGLPEAEEDLKLLLNECYSQLDENQKRSIFKYAFIQRSTSPKFDFDYRFVQMVLSPQPLFDFHCSCGHSAIAAVTVAQMWGWLPDIIPGRNIRVRIKNNEDVIICQVDEISRDVLTYTIHFIQPLGTKLGTLLLTGEPLTMLKTAIGVIETSMVSAGNPYVFIDASTLGIRSSMGLFTAGEDVFTKLQFIRIAAAQYLGWGQDSLLPKIAILGAFDEGYLTARAISVPSWHPSLALTGAVCLGAAAAIDTSVVGNIAHRANCAAKKLRVQTPKGFIMVKCLTTSGRTEDTIDRISISDKRVRLIRHEERGD